MPWITIIVFILGVAATLSAKSVVLSTIGFLVGAGALVTGIFSFISARISENSRSEITLLTDKDLHKLRASLQQTQTQKKEMDPPPSPSPSLMSPTIEIPVTPTLSRHQAPSNSSQPSDLHS